MTNFMSRAARNADIDASLQPDDRLGLAQPAPLKTVELNFSRAHLKWDLRLSQLLLRDGSSRRCSKPTIPPLIRRTHGCRLPSWPVQGKERLAASPMASICRYICPICTFPSLHTSWIEAPCSRMCCRPHVHATPVPPRTSHWQFPESGWSPGYPASLRKNRLWAPRTSICL
jgi:hypothetical protein